MLLSVFGGRSVDPPPRLPFLARWVSVLPMTSGLANHVPAVHFDPLNDVTNLHRLAHNMSGNRDTGVAYCLGSNAAPDLQ
jgi:hypothetical protein